MDLSDFFHSCPKAALAFSGGCDSAYLLAAARKLGCDIRPYFVKSQFQPHSELRDALQFCGQNGITLAVLEEDILQDDRIRKNPPGRCYHCKQRLMRLIKERSRSDGCEILLDGTNASDSADDRPGMKVLREEGILSPLRLCGITKEAVRRHSREMGLFTWNKPSYACLATRVPENRTITSSLLQSIEAAEEELLALGFRGFRLRVYHEAARLQVRAADMEQALRERNTIRARLKPYFNFVLLDLEERKSDG